MRIESAISEGTGGVVNELLVQMQSFDEVTGGQRFRARLIDRVNGLLPASRQLPRAARVPTNILLIAATNRADNLDPARYRWPTMASCSWMNYPSLIEKF